MVPALNASWISKLHNRGAFADGCIWKKKPAGLKAAARKKSQRPRVNSGRERPEWDLSYDSAFAWRARSFAARQKKGAL